MAVETATEQIVHTIVHTVVPEAEHVVRCVACESDRCAGNVNDEGLWYGYCVLCGVRFWDRR